MTKVEAVNPCLRAFWDERDLPCGERGPVEWAALARLAARCLSEMGSSESGMLGPSNLRYSIGGKGGAGGFGVKSFRIRRRNRGWSGDSFTGHRRRGKGMESSAARCTAMRYDADG